MTSKEKIIELKKIIIKELDSIIDRDYVFLDLPYHPNIGDTLIAMAAKNYLNRLKYKCLYYSSEFTFDDRFINSDTLIIFNGGGNFGDLWYNYTEFRNRIIKKYSNNHILILPQSTMYLEESNIKKDVEVYSTCSHITICARDNQSYDFLKHHYDNCNIILVPDMAFFTNHEYIRPNNKTGKTLFLKRNDKEWNDNAMYSIVPREAEVHDWPTLERTTFPYWILYRIMNVNNHIIKRFNIKLAWKIEDFYWQKILHPYNLRVGVRFINNYDIIYTTRLHVAIIGVLLGKKIYFFDNSYHKNSALYFTWLKDVDNIQLVD